MKYQVAGTVMQTLALELDPGEVVYCQTHAMAWMTDNIDMSTNTPTSPARGRSGSSPCR